MDFDPPSIYWRRLAKNSFRIKYFSIIDKKWVVFYWFYYGTIEAGTGKRE
jgi:hypothetical protein